MSAPLNRRGFLRGATAAVPALSLGLAPTIARTATAAENSELLALIPELDAAEAAFLAADVRKRQAVAAYEALAPAVPDDLVLSREDQRHFCGVWESDVEGKTIYPPGVRPARVISTVQNLTIEVKDYGPRTKLGRVARCRLPIAERYEADLTAAKRQSGVRAAIDGRYLAGVDVEMVAGRIAAVEALTIVGLGVKARAMLAVAKVDSTARIRAACIWGMDLADAVAALSTH